MISDWGLIYDEIKDWARSKADGAQMWYQVLVSASKVWWLELNQLSLCSEFDKENSMEFLFNSLLLIHFTTVAMCLLSHGPYVTLVIWHTVTVTITWHLWPSVTPMWHCDKVMWYFSMLHLVVVSPIRKEKKRKRKRNINNDLAVLPSHDRIYFILLDFTIGTHSRDLLQAPDII